MQYINILTDASHTSHFKGFEGVAQIRELKIQLFLKPTILSTNFVGVPLDDMNNCALRSK